MRLSEITEGLNLYDLHDKPEELNHYNDIKRLPWTQPNHTYVDPEIFDAAIRSVDVYSKLCLMYGNSNYDVDADDERQVEEIASSIASDIEYTHHSKLPLWQRGGSQWENRAINLVMDEIEKRFRPLNVKEAMSSKSLKLLIF